MAKTKNHELKPDDKEQSKLFIKAARALGCDEDPAHFDEILKKVARHKPPPHAPPEPKKSKTKKTRPVSGFLIHGDLRMKHSLGQEQFSLSIIGALPALPHPILL
jgi:hypothetical protein